MQLLKPLVVVAALAAPAAAQPAPPAYPTPLPPGTAPAPEPSAPTLAFQIGGGYLNSGSVYVEDVELTENGGPIASIAIDSIVTPRLSVGLFAVAATTDVDGTDVKIGTVGATIKARFGAPTATQFRVGVAFGYQTIEVSEEGESETIRGFDIAPILELAFPTTSSLTVVLQTSAISQPVGGNDDVDVTFAPIGYAGVLLEIRN